MLNSFPFVLLRSPLQSIQKVYEFPEDFETLFEEGLYLSSPEFWLEFQKRNELSEKNKEKLLLSFSKYWIRSCMRCTPYGTFAGSLLVNISNSDTNITLDKTSHLRSVRIDMNYMARIIDALVQLPVIRKQTKFWPNNSIYSVADQYRYAEYSIENNLRNYTLTSVEKTDYLQYLLESAKDGKTIDELTQRLALYKNVGEEEATEFVDGMCKAQLLLPELEPAITGQDPLQQLIDKLSGYKNVESILTKLNGVRQLLTFKGKGAGYYQSIERFLNDLSLGVNVPRNTVQVDLFLSCQSNSINEELISSITAQAQDLMLLARSNINQELEDFKTKFFKKYEEEEIPLSIALDADIGIGYSGVYDQSVGHNDLINDLAVGGGSRRTSVGQDYIGRFASTKYLDFLENNRPFIEISDKDLKTIESPGKEFHFPNSMFLMGSLFTKVGVIDKDNFIFSLSAFGGPSAGNLLGRFTHGSEELHQLTKQVLEKEERDNPDVMYAEITHLPEARVGNILLRPVLRKYEIPYIGKSGALLENQIFVDDLLVSIRNSEIVLRSRKHNKRVIPRLTTAHNFGYKSLPVYKFLCDLQTQNMASPAIWDWGYLSDLKHLPRVVYKNIILKKARWIVDESDFRKFSKDESSFDLEFCLKALAIPKRVVYVEGDNQLLIDFDEAKGRELFAHYLKRYKRITLEEFLFDNSNSVVRNTDNLPFANEIIIPLYTESKTSISSKIQQAPNIIQRKFVPGGEWLYFKIYCGSKTAEKILSQIILPFIEKDNAQNLYEKFFFLRYRDDFSHIRLRFYNSNPEKQAELQKQILEVLAPAVGSGLINKIVLDTYSRELERYEVDLIEEAESLFFNDSLCVLRFISLLEAVADGEKYRLLFALRGIDMFLDDFGFTLNEKRKLLANMQNSFFKEFGGHLSLQKQLNEKYRKYQKDIFSHLNKSLDIENEITEAVEIFIERSEMNKSAIESIFRKIGDKDKEMLFKLLPSYIHMFMNRLFLSQQRKYELIVYHFLEKYYTSSLAIIDKINEPKNKRPDPDNVWSTFC